MNDLQKLIDSIEISPNAWFVFTHKETGGIIMKSAIEWNGDRTLDWLNKMAETMSWKQITKDEYDNLKFR